MADVHQIDLFVYLQEIEEQEAARQPAPAPVPTKPIMVRTPFLKRLGAALSWFWIVTHNVFGLARWVNVYTVTRCFGGREAGGWYYLRYECEKSRQVGLWEAYMLRMKWLEQYSSLRWGDIRSKNGGQDVLVCIEPRKAARRTLRTPRYDEYADQAIPYALVQGGN
ncbi:hypothetical protein ACLBWT_18480 [Paenibacillus sp. D51F]